MTKSKIKQGDKKLIKTVGDFMDLCKPAMKQMVNNYVNTNYILRTDVEKAVRIAIKFGTLPNPNPYGKWVSVTKHNQVIKNMSKIINKSLKIDDDKA